MQSGSTIIDIVNKLSPLNRAFCSDDYDIATAYLKNILPFKSYFFTNNEQYNNWVIPPKVRLSTATISFEGDVVYDGLSHPLAVPTIVAPFEGEVSLEVLKKHLYYSTSCDSALPFHFRYQYRSWDRDWGFCVPKMFYDSLKEGTYHICIETDETDGRLEVLEYFHQGELDETFVFVAHLDHPGQANDDISGVAVGVELFRRLSGKKTKFSYALIIVPEIIGSEYYLGSSDSLVIKNMYQGCFLEALGAGKKFAIQKCNAENCIIESYMKQALSMLKVNYDEYEFGTNIVNDEKNFEAYGIPMCSFSRFPYDEYHTDSDNAALISEELLLNAVDIMQTTIDCIESDIVYEKNFTGTVCLSNPDLDLYFDMEQTINNVKTDKNVYKWQSLLSNIFVPQKRLFLTELCEISKLDRENIDLYLQKWVDKGLLHRY